MGNKADKKPSRTIIVDEGAKTVTVKNVRTRAYVGTTDDDKHVLSEPFYNDVTFDVSDFSREQLARKAANDLVIDWQRWKRPSGVDAFIDTDVHVKAADMPEGRAKLTDKDKAMRDVDKVDSNDDLDEIIAKAQARKATLAKAH